MPKFDIRSCQNHFASALIAAATMPFTPVVAMSASDRGIGHMRRVLQQPTRNQRREPSVGKYYRFVSNGRRLRSKPLLLTKRPGPCAPYPMLG